MDTEHKDAPAEAPVVRLDDYRPPAWLAETVDLHFDLDARLTTVTSHVRYRRNPAREAGLPLVVDLVEAELVSVALDGAPLAPERLRREAGRLVIDDVPDAFTLTAVTRLRPETNTALEGLYVSGDMLCTQCEAEGFRRITPFPDRPDVMARYRVTLEADKTRYPVLLANGNPVAQEDLPGGRHRAVWEDPFPKPCYLFALVAGDLACREETWTTVSGREVAIRLWVERDNLHKCDHALRCIRQAMAWDEERFGREYDLDVFNVVAVSHFNMGAMENKGLNIFNAACVLASPDTATDDDYYRIQAIIGHEYFHNWSGNRVTCRDWFQLSLKEGFTVFRDQEFSADLNSRPVKRIDDVNLLRTRQFPEDAGPLAHPVRPREYQEISNFYTVTVYEKGAEVVRMLQAVLGREAFRRGTDLFFGRHDGQAVTTEDFLRCMEEAAGRDLSRFQRWYDQAGTPRVRVTEEYDPGAECYTLHLAQHCPPTPGQPDKAPFPVPVAVGLLDEAGSELPLRLEGEAGEDAPRSRVLLLTERERRFRFTGIRRRPVPSLLRHFSAPVILERDWSEDELRFLFTHDTDAFNRWDAGQTWMLGILRRLVDDPGAEIPPALAGAFARTLDRAGDDPAFAARALAVPAGDWLAEQLPVVDPHAVHRARRTLVRWLGERLREAWQAAWRDFAVPGPYRFEARDMGRRALRNLALAYLTADRDEAALALALAHYREAGNMTDRMAALGVLAHMDRPEVDEVLDEFHRRWHHDGEVVDKWLALQAGSERPGTLARVRRLMEHPDFQLTHPNRVRALIGRFAFGNPLHFHAADGSGYAFLADRVIALDALNPQVAARLVQALTRWRRFEPGRRAQMRAALERIAAHHPLSRDLAEVVHKSLQADAG